jgi:hypothetical protein
LDQLQPLSSTLLRLNQQHKFFNDNFVIDMKVIEKDTNRSAQVHLHALGVVNPLDEYGEWVDPADNALCCFVPVEGGQKIKVEGRFAGTVGTHSILVWFYD